MLRHDVGVLEVALERVALEGGGGAGQVVGRVHDPGPASQRERSGPRQSNNIKSQTIKRRKIKPRNIRPATRPGWVAGTCDRKARVGRVAIDCPTSIGKTGIT